MCHGFVSRARSQCIALIVDNRILTILDMYRIHKYERISIEDFLQKKRILSTYSFLKGRGDVEVEFNMWSKVEVWSAIKISFPLCKKRITLKNKRHVYYLMGKPNRKDGVSTISIEKWAEKGICTLTYDNFVLGYNFLYSSDLQ